MSDITSVSDAGVLLQQIDADLKQAMRDKDEVTKLTLRSVKTALTEARTSGTEHELSLAEVIAVLQKEAKRRRDTAVAARDRDRHRAADHHEPVAPRRPGQEFLDGSCAFRLGDCALVDVPVAHEREVLGQRGDERTAIGSLRDERAGLLEIVRDVGTGRHLDRGHARTAHLSTTSYCSTP